MARPADPTLEWPTHPRLKPALRRAWRSRDTVQFGITPAHAVAVGPLDTATGSFIYLLDGTRGLPLLRQEAQAMGLPAGRADSVVARLVAAGLIEDSLAGGGTTSAVRSDARARDRLRADQAALSVLHPDPSAGLRLLGARRATRVQVRGAGRVGSSVAALLSAAGVGQVDVMDGGYVEPWDVLPGGLSPEQIGERRDTAARRLVRSAAPARRTSRAASPASSARGASPAPAACGTAGPSCGVAASAGHGASADPCGPDLVVIAPRDGLAAYAPEPDAAEQLMSAKVPHLYAGVLEGTGVVGPLVLPGITCCAGCMAARRAEREPGWPRMLAQWRSGRQTPVPACDAALATVVAGYTAAQVLALLDGGTPPSVGARLELTLPGLAWDVRPIEPHPSCVCGAMTTSVTRYSSDGEEPQATMSG
ncbi:TOMM precursor leader peptide-binding protein [Streptomyces zagrosensis]|uniref:Bacteriocin biosynthesis cyclodehydratase domain-containing protein n=1 Tax=Streptomyces zagrosensis TaxID=1042984 RepID=A0A7W9QAU0_9ACTN|nr:TOMM precursor leader peptide-binding protein [Streptomyces zagrosensis]MBB5936821.1 bacteriocin biosynthesis cyclodehydratase domain-containing protein [Streptomyces zagrosensis]